MGRNTNHSYEQSMTFRKDRRLCRLERATPLVSVRWLVTCDLQRSRRQGYRPTPPLPASIKPVDDAAGPSALGPVRLLPNAGVDMRLFHGKAV